MNKPTLIRKIREQARRDEENRRDPKFLDAIGFLVAKGLLKTNQHVELLPNKRLRIDDVIWAGQNVEPRILEVLPAAVLRLGRHFDLDPTRHAALARIVARLRAREEHGEDFLGFPYEKIKVWAELPLRDRRVKRVAEKRIVHTFRLSPEAVERLQSLARKHKCSKTAVLEDLLLNASLDESSNDRRSSP